MSRFYREDLRARGMTSPPELSDFAINVVNALTTGLEKPVSLLDVGCGSGNQMQRIVDSVGIDKFLHRAGVDWSATAVELLNAKDTFNQVVHCQSSTLPFADQEFDIAMSIENLEHLYYEQVIPAIEELKRVARYVILITPLPQDVINRQWLGMEIPLAEADTEPVGFSEYLVLEGTVHKSTVYPESMARAGFDISQATSHGFYFAESSNININEIKAAGINNFTVPADTDNYNQHYVELLHKSNNLTL